MKNTAHYNGFSLFFILIAITLIAIISVVGYVALKKPNTSFDLPSAYVPMSPVATPTPNTIPTTTPSTPAPTISNSTDLKVIGGDLDDTKLESVDADFKAMDSSASSL